MSRKKKQRIVVLGGGTGTHTILMGLKKYPLELTAVVAMSDNGGSTGKLRDELDVLPPGDVRQCLVALSTSDALMRSLMNYRFEQGAFKGHSFGNLFLSALEKVTGNFGSAVEKVGEVLRIEGRVIPATLDQVNLMVKVGRDLIRGEEKIQRTRLKGSLEYIWLEPVARANPKALAAIHDADAIVIGPGNFYASLVPNLLVRGIPEAIRKSRAKKIFVCNLMTKSEHTDGYSVEAHTRILERYLGGRVDIVLFNNALPKPGLLERYAREGDTLTSWKKLPKRVLVSGNFLPRVMPKANKVGGARTESSLVRHDPQKLGAAIARILGVRK
ncbi:MAG: hypothetical protein RLZZ416_779 [Candidatus Parcubacteria bacterium]|jgi:uncharacterized cofD-like protein